MSRDLRRHRRLHVQGHADLLGQEISLRVPLADLSLGGCRLGAPIPGEPGDRFDILLETSASEAALPLQAQVVRRTDATVALRFSDPTDDQQRALRKHLRALHGTEA